MFGGEWTVDTFLIAFRLSPSAAANSRRTARLVCTLLFFSFLTNNKGLQRFSSVTFCHSYPYLIFVITVTPPHYLGL